MFCQCLEQKSGMLAPHRRNAPVTRTAFESWGYWHTPPDRRPGAATQRPSESGPLLQTACRGPLRSGRGQGVTGSAGC